MTKKISIIILTVIALVFAYPPTAGEYFSNSYAEEWITPLEDVEYIFSVSLNSPTNMARFGYINNGVEVYEYVYKTNSTVFHWYADLEEGEDYQVYVSVAGSGYFLCEGNK